MINLIVLIFTFILLVTQKILLLNEESLILLSFIVFILLSLNNFSDSISTSLNNQITQIKSSLKESLKKVLDLLQNFSMLNKNLKLILVNFLELKSYYKTFIIFLERLVVNYNIYYLTSTYKKKLNFINKIEEQTFKLLTIIIIKKLNLIIRTKYFYSSSIKVSQFSSINKILLRECIRLVYLKNV